MSNISDCETYADIKQDYWFEPIRAALRQKESESWTKIHKGMLYCLAANGSWPSDRLLKSGYDCSNLCKCGLVHTTFHSLYSCTLSTTFRDQYGLDDLLLLDIRNYPHRSQWVTGIANSPFKDIASPYSDLEIVWNCSTGFNSFFSGHGFGDGSGIHTAFIQTRRCGWGVCSAFMTSYTNFTSNAEAYGPLPGNMQVVPLAETFALFIFLKFSVAYEGKHTFFTDCQYVLDSRWLEFSCLPLEASIHAC